MTQPGTSESDGRKISLVNPLNAPGWDEQMAAYPEASVFHTASWTRVLFETYGSPPVHLAYEDAKGGKAFLPLMETSGLCGSRRGVSLPFSDTCQPLVHPQPDSIKRESDHSSRAAPVPAVAAAPDSTQSDSMGVSEPVEQYEGLLQAALDLAGERRWRFIEFRVPGSGFPGKPAYCTYHGHELELTPTEDALFKAFASSTRRGIRKAEYSGVDFEVSREKVALKQYYDLHCDTRKRQGVPPQSWRFFRVIHEHLLQHNQGFVVLARKNGRPVAGSVFLHFNGRAVYKYGASDFHFQHLRANNLVMWQGIRHCRNIGCRHLDFGRTNPANKGLRRFKLGWGTREFSITYHRYSPVQNEFLESTGNEHGWLNSVFMHVPVPLARLAGALLYRYAA